ITCGRGRDSGVEIDTIATLRGEADVTIRNSGEHFSVGEGQQLIIRGGQVTQQNIDTNQLGNQWNNQLQNMGGSVDFGDIPGILRNIRENEGTLIRNLRSSLEGATRESAPALLKAVDRAIGVLDEDAMIMNNFMRRVRESSSRPDQGLVSAIADCLRSNASYRTDVGAMLRQLRQIESLDLGEIPGRLESLRSSLANGMTAIREANAAIPDGTAANAPAMLELRQRVAEYQQTLSAAEAEIGRMQRQLADMINAGQGNLQQARALARQAASLSDAIGGYRQELRRISQRGGSAGSVNIEAEQAAIQELGDRVIALGEEMAGLSDEVGRIREVFEMSRAAVLTPGQAQSVYLDAREALNAIIQGDLADVAADVEELRTDLQSLTEQKAQLIDRMAEKLASSLVLRNLVNDLNRRLSDLANQLNTIGTDLTKFKTEQASLLSSLNVPTIDESVVTQLQDAEEAMSDNIILFENELRQYANSGVSARDILKSSVQVLRSFQRARRLYISAQRLYESVTRGAGRGTATQELEAVQAIWERISDEYQRLSNAAGTLEAELTSLENQLNTLTN
ncbi:MAG TPA: hypothetical protein PKO06_07780, partial [Candidatus Ozemobacteraceae bacterium]|nr:hypothetical protein [Candidatus Ozemobacteraceae bacterium]